GEEAAAIIGVRVFQTRFGASAFEIVVSDPDLKWQGKPTFTECKEVKIELGVPGKLKLVFDGEVTAWRTELERSGPTVIVIRGMDRSHRMMRAHKTKTYKDSTPLDCVSQIAGDYGLTPKTKAGSPNPVKMFRFQANQTDFDFLRGMADLEGYMFWVEAKELHFERPELSSTDDCTFTFGKAALTKRAMEFITAEVEVQGNPEVKPGAMVNLKKVGEYSGHYYVTEANHFYDAAGYNCIFYVARDKWGDSSQTGGGGSGGTGTTGTGTGGTGGGGGGSGAGAGQGGRGGGTRQGGERTGWGDQQGKRRRRNGGVLGRT